MYLRYVGSHFIIVGRQEDAHERLLDPRLDLLTSTIASDNLKKKTWSLKSVEDVEGRPEETFRIR